MQKVIITLSLIIMVVIAAPSGDQVKSLNGFYDFSKEFKMYSGYLTIQQSPSIKAHYVFITSKNNPQTSDVVLWSNGGPGCSSLIGFLTQIGPHMQFPGSQTLSPYKNPYSWNNNANIIFFESPPGVGFSINNDPNYEYNDTRTASDSLKTIKEWFKLFPQYSQNKFWITGQSYAGMFIPLLTANVLKNIDNIVPNGKLNFQGILIGNGIMWTEPRWRKHARNIFYDRHYFYGPQIRELISHCKYDSSDDTNAACLMGIKLADEAVKRINPYNSIGICYQQPPNNNGRKQRKFWYSAFDEQMYNSIQNEFGCTSDDNSMYIYFNNKIVQDQLHVQSTVWQACNSKVAQTFKKDLTSWHLFDSFKSAGLKIVLFSGNVDAQVSYVETEEYIKRIGWKQIQNKMAVKNPRGSLQAWYTKYDGLTLYIVNGAGHMVPTDKPAAALRMFQLFIGGKL